MAIQLVPMEHKFYVEQGLVHAKSDHYQAAIEDYDKAIELDPDDADAYYNRGCACDKLGQASNVQRDWDKARSLESG